MTFHRRSNYAGRRLFVVGMGYAGGGVGFSPSSLGTSVLVDATVGLYDSASGGSPVVADGSTVNGWANSGSYGSRLSKLSDVTGPVLRTNSGVPYLEFGPTAGGKYALGIDITTGASGDITIAMLMRHDVSASGQLHPCAWSTQGESVNAGGGLGCYLADQTYGLTVGVGSGDNLALGTSHHPVTDGKWHLIVWRRTAGNPSTWDVFVDGVLAKTATTVTTEAVVNRFNVGGPESGIHLFGGVAVAMMKRASLSDADVALLSNYYRDRHPLMAADDKVMVVCGDSTSTPQDAFADWDHQAWLMVRGTVWQYGSYLQANNGLGRFWNNSEGGKSTSQHRAEVVRVAAWLSRGGSKRVLVIDLGTNDIRAGGAGLTPAQSYAQISGLISDVRAAVAGRVEVVVCTICDGNPAAYVGFTALRNTLNGLIVAGAVAGDYTVARVDQDDIGLDWGDAARLDTYFYGDPLDPGRDGLHPIAPGMDRKAIVIRSAVASVL